jgi:hypothetical protein
MAFGILVWDFHYPFDAVEERHGLYLLYDERSDREDDGPQLALSNFPVCR